MDDLPAKTSIDLTILTAEIVSAFVSSNRIDPQELTALISTTHAALAGLNAEKVKAPEPLVPPVSIKKSLTDDYMISLEDGKRYKSLKRHLSGRGLTPAQYRTKWGLPNDYPMVAPSYARQRSELAKQLGLGQQRRKDRPATAAETSAAAAEAKPAKAPARAKAAAKTPVKRAPKQKAAVAKAA